MTRRFRFIDRGCEDTMLLIPGWAADSRIFEPLDIPFNYLLPKNIPALFKLRRRDIPDGLHLFGWSMGGLIAAHLASGHPSTFKSVTLVSVRPRYGPDMIEKIKGKIRRNTKAYLHKFYEVLFSESEGEIKRWFDTRLLKRYIEEMKEEILLEGLDYLSLAELKCGGLAGHNVMFVHGDADSIAPIEEIRSMMKDLPGAKLLCMEGAGHAPFLRQEFSERFAGKIGTVPEASMKM